MTGAPTGLLWIGPLYQVGGYGSVTRNHLVGLSRIGFPVKAQNVVSQDAAHLDAETVALLQRLERAELGPRPIALVHWSPDLYPRVRLHGASALIGHTVFETDRIPASWVKPCRDVREVWVPTQFNRRTFSESGIPRERLRVLPHSLDVSRYAPGPRPRLPGLKRVTFFSNFVLDWRKGFDLLLEAYCSEFTAADDVSLLIKTFWVSHAGIPHGRAEDLLRTSVADRVDWSRPNLPHWKVLDHMMLDDDLLNLYRASDVFISTERACGWGYPCMEAMALGLPAIAIAWGGSTEFMTPENSVLIPTTGRLVPVDARLAATRPGLYGGHQWAEVEVGAVRKAMRDAYEHPERLRPLAARGAQDIRERFSSEAVAHQIVAGLTTLEVSGGTTFSGWRAPRATLKLPGKFLRLRRVLRAPFTWVFGETQTRRGIGAVKRLLWKRGMAGIPLSWEGPRPVVSKLGVNFAGHLTSESGVGEASRGMARALEAAAIPAALRAFTFSPSRKQDHSVKLPRRAAPEYDVTLLHANADEVSPAYRAMGPAWFDGKYVIGYWVWELANFPERWHDRFRPFHEIWTPSHFCASALIPAAPVPVWPIPHAVQPPATAPDKARWNLPPDRTVFLFTFSYYSVFERKNPLAVIEAFRRAFGASDRALLVLKAVHPEADRRHHALLREAAASHPSIRLLEALHTREDVWSLMASCDAYVSLHRSEGFGLTLAEAMALGKPVIATGYSGNMDYMRERNSFPVPYRLAPLEADFGPYAKGHLWAEPDVDEAARLLRRIADHPDDARETGRRAAETLKVECSPAAVGARIRARLDALRTAP